MKSSKRVRVHESNSGNIDYGSFETGSSGIESQVSTGSENIIMGGDMNANAEGAVHSGINRQYTTTDIIRNINNGSNSIKKIKVHQITDKCSDLVKCIQQQGNAYGFLPITNLDRINYSFASKPRVVLKHSEFCPIKIHHRVKASGKSNFEGERIQLPTNINVDKFEILCKDYWDWQLIHFLRFEFPL